MPRTSSSTPKKRERVRELRASGVGLREAAKAVGVSHETVRAWERADAARGAVSKPAGPKAAPKPAARPAARKTSPVAEDAAAASAVLAASLPSPSDPEALAMLRARAALVGTLLTSLTPAVESGDFAPTSYVTLCRYGDDLARMIADLTPPAPKNPEDDPDVIAAERALLARLETMIGEAESK